MKIKGESELLRNLSNFAKEKVRALYQASAGVQAMVANDARMSCPVAFTTLLKSIQPGVVEVTNDEVRAEIKAESEYASYVEMGTRPHWPPVDALRPWAGKVLGDENLAFLVARAISKRGTKPQPFLGPALYANQNVFKRAIAVALKP